MKDESDTERPVSNTTGDVGQSTEPAITFRPRIPEANFHLARPSPSVDPGLTGSSSNHENSPVDFPHYSTDPEVILLRIELLLTRVESHFARIVALIDKLAIPSWLTKK